MLHLLSESAEPLAVVDAHTLQILAATSALGDLLGRPAPALVRLNFAALLDPHEQAEVTALLGAFTQDGTLPPRRSYLFVGGDGTPLPSDLRGLRLTLPSGRRVACMTLRPLQELLETVPFYRLVLEELPLALTVQDAQGRYVYINPFARPDDDLRAQAIGRTVREVLAADGRPEATALEREAQFRLAEQTRGRVEWQEVSARSDLNTPLLTRRVAVPVFEAGGGPLSLMLSFARDVTLTAWQSEQIQLLESLVHAAADPLAILDVRPGATYQHVVHANPALRRMLANLPDAPPPAFPANPRAWVRGPRDRQIIDAALRQLQGHGEASRVEDLHLPDLDKWYEVSFTPVSLSPGQLTHWTVVMRDMTRRRRSQAFTRDVMASVVLSLRGAPLPEVLDQVLRGMEKMLPPWSAVLVLPQGGRLEVHGGRVPQDLRAWMGRHPAAALTALWASRDPQRLGRPMTFHDPFGGRLADTGVLTSVEVALYDSRKTLLGVLAVLHPGQPHTAQAAELLTVSAGHVALVVERHQQRQQLQWLAYHDPLTGLLNRAGFSRDGAQALEQAAGGRTPLALGMLDLNRFKLINDRLGHAAGDRLLQAFARRLQEAGAEVGLRLLTRMGGDEFAFVLGDPAQMQVVSAALARMVAEPFVLEGRALHVGLALGWSVFPDTAMDLDTMLQQADSAMYVAKLTQQTSSMYSPAAHPSIAGFELESELDAAILSGHLSLSYQPQVRAGDRQVVGAEALLRWSHPRIGNIAPAEFIPLAESLGLIGRLGRWVIDRACQDAAAWPNRTLTVSINVSVLQVQDPDFQAVLESAAVRHGITPRRIVIELTETALISDLPGLQATLEQLRGWGVRVAVDDFGTGYSTLLSLRQLRVDELKIDRSFVEDLADPGTAGRDSRAIVEATLTLAATFGLGVVAEGVETEQQAQLLQALGCPVWQGQLTAPGLTQPEFLSRYGG